MRSVALALIAFSFAVCMGLGFPETAPAPPGGSTYSNPTQQLCSPGFVYAESVRGHIVVINWEPETHNSRMSSSPGPYRQLDNVTYYVYRAEGGTSEPGWPNAAWTEITGGISGRANTSWVDESAKKTSTRYWYVVQAADASNNRSQVSPIGNGLTVDYLPGSVANVYRWYTGPTTRPPVEPGNIQLAGSDSSITVSWDAVPSTNVAYYRIYRATSSGEDSTTVQIGRVSGTQTSFMDGTAEKYRHYWYRIAAEDDHGAVGFKSVEQHFRTVSSAQIDAPHGGGSGSSAPGTDTCGMCHDIHCAAAPKLLCSPDEMGEPELCMSCHDGTGSRYDTRREFTDMAMSSHEVTITAGDGSVLISGGFTCIDCHTPHGDPSAAGSKKLLNVDGVTEGNGVCYGAGCHGSGGTTHWAGDMSGFDASVHSTGIPDPVSGTKVKCSSCHMPHASPNDALWVGTSYRTCLVCHSSENVSLSSPDIYTRMTANQDYDSHHDVLSRDQAANGTFIACQNCHNTHIVTEANPLVDPEDPSMAGMWAEGPSDPIAVTNGTATAPRYNGFCLVCHDSADGSGLPTQAQTGNWVPAPQDGGQLTADLASQWANNSHGPQASVSPSLDPAMGYARYDTLSCVTCHEAHGTINNYNLRADVPARDGSQPKSGRMLAQVVADINGTPSTQADGSYRYDTRFFCNSCHDFSNALPNGHDGSQASGGGVSKDLSKFPSACTDKGCHEHSNTSRRF